MKHHILICLLFACLLPLQLWAQENTIEVEGTVKDASGATMPGVSVYIKNSPGIGVATDIDGNFKIKVQKNNIIIFSFIGYKPVEQLITGPTKPLSIVLEEDTQVIDEVEVVGYGTQRKISVVGAVTTIEPQELSVSSVTSMTNALAGRVAGLIGVQRSGEPGQDVSEFWIRGISTFGAQDQALFLIDGVERDISAFNNLAPEDIESFSILKDASATAVYGARGASGVVIVTTKHGKAGRMTINANVKTMLEWLPKSKMPDYLGAYDYAALANEARAVRGEDPVYNPAMMDVIKYHLDPDLYPDVDWQKELLKPVTWGLSANVGISGGGDVARYYISGNFRTNDAAYKQSGLNNYNTNVLRKQYTFRANVDVNATKTTLVSLNLATDVTTLNRPGIGSTSEIWDAQANLNPLTVPIKYSNGQLPAYGSESYQASPVVLLNETGYATDYTSTVNSVLSINQNLDKITKGLSLSASLSFDVSSTQNSAREKMPELYLAIGRDSKGNLMTERKVEKEEVTYSSESSGSRQTYLEAKINYNRVFDKHRVSGLLLYNQTSSNSTAAADAISSIPQRNQGIAGRFTYSYDDIYFIEGNFGYNGTPNFPKGQRFNFFPSIAFGWVPSNYATVKDKLPWLSLFKLRYSFGAVGNDQVSGARFPYMTEVSYGAAGYNFGINGENAITGITETRIGSDNLKWERALKHNVGIDLNIWDKLSITVDYFHDLRKGIFMERSNLPNTVGIPNRPWGNVGRMRNQGVDGTIAYKDQVGDFSYEVRANFTVTRNKVLDYDEPNNQLPYKLKEGKSLDYTEGYICLGFFRDSTDILNSPRQMDNVRPGDLKYKDVNGDGVINQDDMVAIGNSAVPRIQYGFAGSFSYKNWDLSLFFRGSGGVDFFYGGRGYAPFLNEKEGNVLSIVNDQSNRWTPAWYSGDPSTENPNARFPRLSYGSNMNNYVNSTHWLANGAFLRLKTVEIGYRLPTTWARKLAMSSFRLSLIADNLHVWDKVKLWDPEQASSNGSVYPLTRSITLNLQMAF